MLTTKLERMLLGATFLVMSMGAVTPAESLCLIRTNNPDSGERWFSHCERNETRYADIEVTPTDESSGTIAIRISEQEVCGEGKRLACRFASSLEEGVTCLSKGKWSHPYEGDVASVLAMCACYEPSESCDAK